ncbi:uncharacterized protein LOC126265830 [Aethina tumida]|uniref:uncharacterized protein LOC126265830 n=1 Tax=Aethina tumida TaxID=116153 RepID=UPI002148FD8C|nr:uncharacterized protein LOC126265830 [Aethina tumida]
MSEWFIYGRTSRGKKTLIYQGYEYLRHRKTARSVTHWRCVKRRSNNCMSVMHTMGSEIVQNPGEHTCSETTPPNQLDNLDTPTHSFENEELPDAMPTEQLDGTDPTIKLLVQEVSQSLLKKNLSFQEPDSSDTSLNKSEPQTYLEKNTSTKEPERTHKGVRRIQGLVQAHLEENVTSEQLLTPPVENDFNSQLVHDELEVAAVNIKQELLTQQTINLELVEEEDIKDKEFILHDNNSQDVNFPPTHVSSGRRRESIESFDVDELFNIQLTVAKLDQQIKKEELNFVRMKARNEEECHQSRMKIMLHLFNNL